MHKSSSQHCLPFLSRQASSWQLHSAILCSHHPIPSPQKNQTNNSKTPGPKLTIKSERWSEPELNPLVSESEGLLERESRRERELLSDGVENFSGRSEPMGSKGRKPSGGFPRTFPRGLLSMLRTATERDRVCQGLFAITRAMALHRTQSSLVLLTNMKVGYETDWPGEPTSSERSSEILHPRLWTSEVLWDRALCPVHAIPCHMSWSKPALGGGGRRQLPRHGAHTCGRYIWPTTMTFQTEVGHCSHHPCQELAVGSQEGASLSC